MRILSVPGGPESAQFGCDMFRKAETESLSLKAIQISGIVKDVLKKSATHPHGIKVRQESGIVGCVKELIP